MSETHLLCIVHRLPVADNRHREMHLVVARLETGPGPNAFQCIPTCDTYASTHLLNISIV